MEFIPIRQVTDFPSAQRAFFDMVRIRGQRELDVAAYFLARLEDDTSWQLRAMWADRAPHAVAYGLRGLLDERAWDLRERLAGISPMHVARSLAGYSLQQNERAWRMRNMFADTLPGVVLSTISRNQSDAAWQLREHQWERDAAAVVASLAYVPTERAWDMRDRFSKLLARQSPPDLADVSNLVESLTGLGDERAWELRTRYMELVPIAVLQSLASLADERSWEWRRRYVAHAPKIVLRTFDRSADPRAWQLRAQYARSVKEVFDSMTASNAPEAWHLRQDCLDLWPSTVVKSLGSLGLAERGHTMALSALRRHFGNISLLKHVTRLVHLERTASEPGAHHAS